MARYYKEIAELLEKERAFTEAIEYYIKVSHSPLSFVTFMRLLMLTKLTIKHKRRVNAC
jgi:hypothetical protein